MAAPFVAPSRPSTGWVSAGPASSFPDIAPGAGALSEPHPCAAAHRPGCAVLHVPRTGGATPAATRIALDGSSPDGPKNLTDQVLVFRYRGKFHAVDHQCPHSSYPLSKGTPFDVEDFGIVLSAGITCPKHGWSFDLHSGQSDRGLYKLAVWEVQLRPLVDATGEDDQEVWVRRKPRMG